MPFVQIYFAFRPALIERFGYALNLEMRCHILILYDLKEQDTQSAEQTQWFAQQSEPGIISRRCRSRTAPSRPARTLLGPRFVRSGLRVEARARRCSAK